MFTDNDLKEMRQQESISAQTFYKGVVDFLKWTATLTVAAILWVSNAVESASGVAQVVAIFSLFFLILSLIIAVYTVYWVLSGWAKEWVANIEEERLFLMKKQKTIPESNITEDDEKKQIDTLIKALDATKPYHKPSSFNNRITGHTVTLVAGLAFYITAQIITSFQ